MVTRPGVAIFLLVLLALVGTTYRMVELENEREVENHNLRTRELRQRQVRVIEAAGTSAQRALNLETVPAGATVTEADLVLGNTPLKISFENMDTRVFQLALVGHRRVKYKVDPRSLASEGKLVTRTLNLTPVAHPDQAEEEMVFGVVDVAKARAPTSAVTKTDESKKRVVPGAKEKVAPARTLPKTPRKSQKRPVVRPLPRRDSRVIAPRLPQRRRPAERPRTVVRPNPRPKPKVNPKKADELVNPFD